MSFRIHRRDTELHFMAKFGENWPAKFLKGRLDYHTKNLMLRGTCPSPHFAQNEPIAPKILWMLSPLYLSNVHVSRSAAFCRLIPERLIFRPKSQYNYRLSANNNCSHIMSNQCLSWWR